MRTIGSKKVLVFPMELAAHYLRCIEYCNKLPKKHEILFAYSEKYSEFIEEAGYETFDVENFDSEEVSKAAKDFDFNWMYQTNLERILNSQVDAITENKPDIVLGDTAFTLKMASEITETRFISLLNAYITKYYANTRPVSRKHPGYKYSKMLPSSIFNQIARGIEQLNMTQIHEPYRKIRKTLDLQTTDILLDELEGDYNLICDIPSIFPMKNPPNNFEYIGPLYYSKSNNEEEAIRFLDDHHPSILVSMGSSGEWDGVTKLSDPVFKDYRIIITGESLELQGYNVYSKPFLNHCAVLPHIDLVICHGGNGTIYQALAYGVPVICSPSNFEQEWNASQIQNKGLGIIIDEETSPSELKRDIDNWITKKGSSTFSEVKNEIKQTTYSIVNLPS